MQFCRVNYPRRMKRSSVNRCRRQTSSGNWRLRREMRCGLFPDTCWRRPIFKNDKLLGPGLLTRVVFARVVLGPRTSIHIRQRGRFPLIFGMLLEERRGFEIRAAGMADARDEA